MKYIMIKVIEKPSKLLVLLVFGFIVYGLLTNFIGKNPTEGGKSINSDNQVVVSPNDYVSRNYLDYVDEQTNEKLLSSFLDKYNKEGISVVNNEVYQEESGRRALQREYVIYDGYVTISGGKLFKPDYITYMGDGNYTVESDVTIFLAPDYNSEQGNKQSLDVITKGKLTVIQEKFLFFFNRYKKEYEIIDIQIQE